jgi:uncharacterized protein YdeI (YjbR/CyaY-like superfamily)
MAITRPSRSEVHVFPDARALRRWLAANHDEATAAWFGYYRRETGKTSVTYAEAVDEALCFGWIDGITYRVDEEVTANRFTPRRKGSYWSTVNIAKAERLIGEGRMTPAGFRAFEARDESAVARYSYENRPADLPPPMLATMRSDPAAFAYWQNQAPSYRRAVAFWVTSAKQEATRERRLRRLIADSAAGRPVGPMTSGRAPANSERAT